MKDFWSIQPKRPPKGVKAWVARKLIRIARWLAPTDDGVLADTMTEVLKQQMLYGHVGFRVLSAEDMTVEGHKE